MKILSEVQKAYIAGIVDGEGTICLGKVKARNENCEDHFAPVVQVANTNMKLLHWLRNQTGTGKIRPGHSRESSKRKLAWLWYLSIPEIEEFLQAILPYLVIKDEQARLLLEYLDENRGCRGNNVAVDWKIKNGREFIFQELKRLNQKGV